MKVKYSVWYMGYRCGVCVCDPVSAQITSSVYSIIPS